jgi:hypothetical protein
VVHLPAVKAQERGLEAAIGHYFDYRAGMIERDLHDLLRVGRRSLGIGLGVLAACIALAQIVRTTLPDWPLNQLLAEGLMVFGWVANRRPAEIFFYDIWAVRRRVHLYRRPAAAQVVLRPF